jgi:hypothetical protein
VIWRFSDGTTVELGGNVEGASLFAQQLRAGLADRPAVTIWAEPSPSFDVDPNDAAFLDAWLKVQLDLAVRIDKLPLTMRAPDGIPSLPQPEPYEDEDADVSLY